MLPHSFFNATAPFFVNFLFSSVLVFTGVVAVFYFQTVKDGIIYANSTISQVYECKKCKAELLQIR